MYSAVIGLGFGDEGKGLTTDYLCSKAKNPLVVRFSGGQQAGHTVHLDGVRHVFSNFGSGTMRGIPTYWSEFCIVDPIGIVNELQILEEKGFSPVLLIDSKCPVTTPYDAYKNQKEEEVNQHGSCGVGIGTTMAREEAFYSLTALDLMFPYILKIKLENIRKFYNFKENVKLDRFFECVGIIHKKFNIKIENEFPSHRGFSDFIFEGSQGLLLDQHNGFFPNVTRANIGSKNLLKLDSGRVNYPELYLITRAYQTRHGNGAMTNENIGHNIRENENETNVTNKYQGEFRRTLLDVDLLAYAILRDDFIRDSQSKNLVITCLDHIVDEWRFTYNGQIITALNENDFIERISTILCIDSVYISRGDSAKDIVKWK